MSLKGALCRRVLMPVRRFRSAESAENTVACEIKIAPEMRNRRAAIALASPACWCETEFRMLRSRA